MATCEFAHLGKNPARAYASKNWLINTPVKFQHEY